MRKPLELSIAALILAAGVSACRDARATDAQAELQRDLELAASTVSLASPQVDAALLNAMETKPQGAPEAAPVVKKAAGPRAVRSQTPTVRATPEVEVAALNDQGDVTQVESIAPAPDITEPVAVAPRPQPVIVQTGGTAGGDYGTGGGVFGGGGGGVIIRGGGIDGDNCELHRRGRGNRGPIYVPTPNVPSTGGILVNRPPSRDGIGGGSGGSVTRVGVPSRSSGSVGRTSGGSVTRVSPPARSSPARSSGSAGSRSTGGSARGALSPRGR